jgi:hypothetical protein
MKTPQVYIETIANIVTEQNKELLKIIAKEYKLSVDELINKYIVSRTQFRSDLEKCQYVKTSRS